MQMELSLRFMQLQEIEKMKGRDFVQQLLDGTVLNEKHRKIVAQVTSGLE